MPYDEIELGCPVKEGAFNIAQNWLEVAIFDGFVFDFGVEVWGTEKA